jgi:hypothetical protein
VSPVRRPPVETIGVVDIYAPTSTPYFRLKWPEPDGTPVDTSGGTTLDSARYKATEIDSRVGVAAGPLAVTPLEVMVGQFLFEARSPQIGIRADLDRLHGQAICSTIPRGFGACSGTSLWLLTPWRPVPVRPNRRGQAARKAADRGGADARQRRAYRGRDLRGRA